MRRLVKKLARHLGLKRVKGVAPPSTREYLVDLHNRLRVDQAYCYDSDSSVHDDLLTAFSSERVHLGLFLPKTAGPTFFGVLLLQLEIDSSENRNAIFDTLWLHGAEVILIRASLGLFLVDSFELTELLKLLRMAGFYLYDVLDSECLSVFDAASRSITMAFEKASTAFDGGNAGGRLRCREAVVYLDQPLARSSSLTRLAGPGSFGFRAGVLNPGAIWDAGRVILLARGEHIPWAHSRQVSSQFFEGVRPLLIELDELLSVESTRELDVNGQPLFLESRVEDYRLFRFKGELLCGHSIFPRPEGNHRSGALKLKSLIIKVGVSKVDISKRKLSFLGTPKLDLTTKRTEKNWVYFEQGVDLYLIYSFAPYHLLKSRNWPDLDFDSVMKGTVHGGVNQLTSNLRNSVNPIDYDGKYMLHVVHEVFPQLRYVFWAVLIEKSTLAPAMISSRPLVCGWRSAPASIIYVSSIIARPSDILVFAGLNDSATAVWSVSREDLNASWTPIVFANEQEFSHGN